MKTEDITDDFVVNESTILIVDDDDSLRYILQNQIAKEKYNILTSSELKDTFDLLERFPIDLIIMDYHLVGIKGTEIIKEVKKQYPFTKCILLSGQINQNNIESIVDIVDDFVLKPYDINDLLLRVYIQIKNKKKMEEQFESLTFEKIKPSSQKFEISIIIADDDTDITHILKINYKSEYINVTTVNSLAEAKLLISNPKFKYDIAIVDIYFPDNPKGGFEIIGKLKEKFPECKIIVYTGSDTSDYEITKTGVDLVFRKPMQPFALLSNLNSIVRTKVLENKLQYNLLIQTKLNEFSNKIKTLDLWSVRNEIETAIKEIFEADYYFFILLEKNTSDLGYFYIHSHKEISNNKEDVLINIKDDYLASIIENKQSVSKVDEYLYSSSIFKNKKMRHYIFYPIKYALKVTGILFLARDSRYFSQKDFSNIETFADILSRQIEIVNEHSYEKEKSETAGKLSITDELTKVYNTRYFLNAIKKIFEKSQRNNDYFSLLIIDIDFFKKFNDTYGHKIGDLVLQKIAKVIQISVRETKDVVARYGGEEFCVILPKITHKLLNTIAERIRSNIEKYELKTSVGNLKITVSIGGTTYSEKIPNSDKMFKIADAALYKAKQTGRNKVVISNN